MKRNYYLMYLRIELFIKLFINIDSFPEFSISCALIPFGYVSEVPSGSQVFFYFFKNINSKFIIYLLIRITKLKNYHKKCNKIEKNILIKRISFLKNIPFKRC